MTESKYFFALFPPIGQYGGIRKKCTVYFTDSRFCENGHVNVKEVSINHFPGLLLEEKWMDIKKFHNFWILYLAFITLWKFTCKVGISFEPWSNHLTLEGQFFIWINLLEKHGSTSYKFRLLVIESKWLETTILWFLWQVVKSYRGISHIRKTLHIHSYSFYHLIMYMNTKMFHSGLLRKLLHFESCFFFFYLYAYLLTIQFLATN